MVKIHTALLVVCAVAVLGCAGLSVPLFTRSAPEACCAGPMADPASLPSPTTPAPATRKAGLPHCLVGSWQVVAEQTTFKFYTDVGPLPFTSAGGLRYYEFHPDGTLIERNVDFTMVSDFQGQQLRWVRNGERRFTWSATDKTITYSGLTATTVVHDYYDRRGRLNPSNDVVDPNYVEVDDISCTGTQVVESTTRETNYRATWQRTADYGVYG